jgi:hypothetical protein
MAFVPKITGYFYVPANANLHFAGGIDNVCPLLLRISAIVCGEDFTSSNRGINEKIDCDRTDSVCDTCG